MDYVKELAAIRDKTGKAYRDLSVLLACSDTDRANRKLASGPLDCLEEATIKLRNYVESACPPEAEGQKPSGPSCDCSGSLDVTSNGWLHIHLNTLLPHCRYRTPKYLADTIHRLITDYQSRGGVIPFFQTAVLVLDEHCDLESRRVYDEDNKGWKAISNSLKGLVFSDDDQFSLQVCLFSTWDTEVGCDITVLPKSELTDYFSYEPGCALFI